MKNKNLMRGYVTQCGGKRKNKFSEAQPESMEYHDVIDTFHPLPPNFLSVHFILPYPREEKELITPPPLFINTSLSLPFCLIVNGCGIFPSKQRRRFEINVKEGGWGWASCHFPSHVLLTIFAQTMQMVSEVKYGSPPTLTHTV